MSARLVRTSLLAAALSALIAVPVALAAGAERSAGPLAGMPGMPGMADTSTTQAPLRGGLQALQNAGPVGGPGAQDQRGPGADLGPLADAFAVRCSFAREAMDDPIVSPGQSGKSHDHTFVGNLTILADSTNASLLAGDTTCRDRADRSAYWMPTLIVAGRNVMPRVAYAVYRKAVAATVVAFPDGFRMIAGDAHALAAQPTSVVAWSCGRATAGAAVSQTPPICADAGSNNLQVLVTFPSCWDGVSLDSADHTSHMAYPVAGACPAGHAVAVPELTLRFSYPTAGGSDVRLGSGASITGHADFMNAWSPGTLARKVARRLNGVQGQDGQNQGQGVQGPRPQGGPSGLGGQSQVGPGGLGGPIQGGPGSQGGQGGQGPRPQAPPQRGQGGPGGQNQGQRGQLGRGGQGQGPGPRGFASQA